MVIPLGEAENGRAENGSAAHRNAARAPELDRAVLVNLGFAETIAVPLELSDGNVAGLLVALSPDHDSFGTDDVILIGVAARYLGYEWERVRSRAELRELRGRLRDGDATDADTGLPNRDGFDDLLTREWQLARRGTVPSTVVAFELEVIGEDEAPPASLSQLALRDAAEVLGGAVRTTDHAGRVDSMTLGVVMIGSADPDGVEALSRRFEEALHRATRGRPFDVAVHVGFRMLAACDSAEEALQGAELDARELRPALTGRAG
jgi:GGDEF domain-containing protein